MIRMEKTSQFKALDERYFMPAFSRDMAIVKGAGIKSLGCGRKGISRLRCRDCRLQHRALPPGCREGDLRTGPRAHPLLQPVLCSRTRETLRRNSLRLPAMHKAFFSNSGAEATDGALKLARVRTGKKKFVAFTHGFHGRTVGSLAVTHKPAIREPFEPLGMVKTFVEYGDLEVSEKSRGQRYRRSHCRTDPGRSGCHHPPGQFH